MNVSWLDLHVDEYSAIEAEEHTSLVGNRNLGETVVFKGLWMFWKDVPEGGLTKIICCGNWLGTVTVEYMPCPALALTILAAVPNFGASCTFFGCWAVAKITYVRHATMCLAANDMSGSSHPWSRTADVSGCMTLKLLKDWHKYRAISLGTISKRRDDRQGEELYVHQLGTNQQRSGQESNGVHDHQGTIKPFRLAERHPFLWQDHLFVPWVPTALAPWIYPVGAPPSPVMIGRG
jgi:hypothetical protein